MVMVVVLVANNQDCEECALDNSFPNNKSKDDRLTSCIDNEECKPVGLVEVRGP